MFFAPFVADIRSLLFIGIGLIFKDPEDEFLELSSPLS
jgi:hypothetical protein